MKNLKIVVVNLHLLKSVVAVKTKNNRQDRVKCLHMWINLQFHHQNIKL
jgi:hypothetical protein